MFRRGSMLFLPYQVVYILALLAITLFVIWFYRDIDATFRTVSDQFIRNQISIVEEFSENIEKRLATLVPDDPVDTLAEHPELYEHVNHILSLFSTHHFRYVYILYLDPRGRLRYLADGSYETDERGLFGQKFDPDTDKWRKALESGRAVYVLQKDFTGLWITFYHPLKLWKNRRCLLVFDVSISTLKDFKETLSPIRELLKTVSAILLILLGISIAWSILYYLQRKKGSIDPLTRLYNRNVLPRIRQRIDLRSSSVILADIDHFKRINDRYGHDAGDRVLQFVSRLLLQSTRPEDILIRYGGEEFLILINDVTEKSRVLAIAQRVMNELSKRAVDYNGQRIGVTLSMGVVAIPGSAMTLDEAILHADKMLYIAKTTGRNRMVVYGEEKKIKRRLLFHEVEEAFAAGGLYFVFQPIVDARDFHIVKHEVLARLRDAEGNTFAPDAFIPSIHGTGLYRELTKELLLFTFETIRRHEVRLSINFDVNDFLDETLFEAIFDELSSNRELAHRLTIELLEERPVEDLEELVAKIDRLKALGIEIAIDDFGKGYAGLNYLLNFRPAIIKVDGELVRRIGTHPHVAAILKSIVSTGHVIGVKVVAEGIENEKVLKKMRSMGFDCLQGYFLAPPARHLLDGIAIRPPGE